MTVEPRVLAEFKRKFYVKATSRKSYKAVNVGDVVLIRNEGTQCCFWKLAKVTELISGRDKLFG